MILLLMGVEAAAEEERYSYDMLTRTDAQAQTTLALATTSTYYCVAFATRRSTSAILPANSSNPTMVMNGVEDKEDEDT